MCSVMLNNFNYYDFQFKMVVDKINEEIDFFDHYEFSKCYPFNEYLTYLKGRIGIDRIEQKTMSYQDNSGNKHEIKKMNMDEYGKDLDVYVYKRPWNKLKEFHKIIKIKEFVDNLTFGKKCKPKEIEKNKKYLKDEICNGLKNKKFGKNKAEVTYDSQNMVIISISCLDYNKKKGLYEIDWEN